MSPLVQGLALTCWRIVLNVSLLLHYCAHIVMREGSMVHLIVALLNLDKMQIWLFY